MIYTNLTKKAMEIAVTAHAGQHDKGGYPYIFHPMYVAMQQTDEATVCVALLHDVAEDTNITLEQIAQEGFGETIIGALRLLTHDKAVPYDDYIRLIADNPVARSVKLADLRHNSDLTRLENPTERDCRRVEKYRRSIEFLENAEKMRNNG